MSGYEQVSRAAATALCEVCAACSAEGADASLRLVGGACGCCELGVAHVGATLQRGWRGLNECQNRLSQVSYILLV